MKIIKKHHKKIERTVVGALFAFLLFLTIISALYALPTAPAINYISNSTSANAGIGTIRSGDEGGFIHTININGNQQDFRWKAYVGNVTGKFVLEDALGFSIYDWSMDLNVQGEVYISRNQTVDWATVNCSNRTTIINEDLNQSINSADPDSINRTFNTTGPHRTFKAAENTILNSTCPSISTYVNATESRQTDGENNIFQEVLLQDQPGNMIYTVLLQDNWLGYNNISYDFQAIIADDETTNVQTTYYFYLELGA